ncbi:MAG TPA: cell division protein FtsB [Burkholderiales bacterium]|nr:cell division protein FtsB [Burkholderiales bacterium]
MKILAGVIGALIILIQVPLWLGKGGWFRAWELEREVSKQKEKNHGLDVRNTGLAAEVKDLKTGTEAVEERARYELGMVRKDEVFYQVVDEKPKQVAPKP